MSILCLGALCLACSAQATEKTPPESSSTGPVRIKIGGEFRNVRQPDGTDIMTCTGGIYISQRWNAQSALLELRAQNAVVFYSQRKLFRSDKTKAGKTDPDEAQAGKTGKADSNERPKPLAVYLEGDVVLQLDRYKVVSDTKITAQRLYYDFANQSAIILDATMRMRLPENNLPIYIRAKRIRQLSGEHYQAEHIKFSNDQFYQPHFWIGARKLDISSHEKPKDDKDKDDPTSTAKRRYHFDVRNVTVNLEDVPVFWWPRGLISSGKAASPLQAVHTSSSSEYGFSLESQWSLPWLLGIPEPDGLDSTLRIDEFTKRGPAAGIDLDYNTDRCFGSLKTYLLNDSGEDRLGRLGSRKDVPTDHSMRGRAQWRHRQYLPDDWQGTFEVSYLSDRNFLESWREREFDTDKEQETLIYLKKQKGSWAFDLLGKFHLNDFDYTMTELPTASLHGIGQDLFGLLTYYQDTSISRFAQQAGDRKVAGLYENEEDSILPPALDHDDFTFALSRHELSLPLHFGSWYLAPTVIGTYVHDESQFLNSSGDSRLDGINDPRYQQPLEQKDFVQGAAGLRAGTQFWRVDNTVKSRLWDLDRMRHVVTPQVSAFWVDTSLDQAEQGHDVFNFAIEQRWQTMRGPEGKKHSIDFLRLNTSVTLVTHDVKDAPLPGSFLFSRPEFQFDTPEIVSDDLANLGLATRRAINQNLSDHAKADWTWMISETTALNGMFNYNIRDGVVSQTNMALAVQRSPRTRYYMGYRFLQNGDPFDKWALRNNTPIHYRDGQFLTLGAAYKINSKYTVALNQQYDIEYSAAAYTRTTIIRKFSHWFGAFSISHDSTRGGVSFMVSFWPEGFDQFVLGSRRFTRLAP